MAKYVTNAISFQMLKEMAKGKLVWSIIDEGLFRLLIEDAESYMGHEDLAEKFDIAYNRKPLTLKAGDVLYVSQVCNNRGTSNERILYFQCFVEE